MKPPPLCYETAPSMEAGLSLLAEYGEDAKVLAGGQSLVPLLAMRLARPSALVDISRLPELTGISDEGDFVSLGATVSERTAEESELVRRKLPLLAAALPLIGHVAIRNRGTVGGSMAHADPAAEIPAVAIALDAQIQATSAKRGDRLIPASEFFLGFWTTALAEDEMLTAVRFPSSAPGTGAAFEEAARRHGDFAIVGAGSSLRLVDGVVHDPRLVFIGVGDRPVRAQEAEGLLNGSEPGRQVIDAATAAATADLQPGSDLHASSAYRRHVAGVLCRRAIEAAVARATGGLR